MFLFVCCLYHDKVSVLSATYFTVSFFKILFYCVFETFFLIIYFEILHLNDAMFALKDFFFLSHPLNLKVEHNSLLISIWIKLKQLR